MHLTTRFIVSFDFSDKDRGVCIVGQQRKGKMDIINAFQDEDARALLDKLITKEGEQHVRIE